MPVSAPSDKRFRRAHVSPGRRRRFWRGNFWAVARAAAIVAISAYGLYRGAALLLPVDPLIVDRLTVTGNTRLSRGEIVALLDGLRGQNMITADLESWRNKLRSLPWVAEVSMRRVLPGTIAVVVLEREPIGVGRIGDSLYLIDRHGSIIDSFGPNYAELDLPIIDGLEASPSEGGLMVDQARAALAVRIIDDFDTRPDLAARVSQVDVTDVHDAVVILKGDTAVLRIGNEQFLKRLQAYVELAPALRERIPQIDYADLRFGERVYVKPHIRNGPRDADLRERR